MTHPFEGLTPDCVVDCVEAIGLRSDLRLLALNSYENRVYQVGIEEADPVIVKVAEHFDHGNARYGSACFPNGILLVISS